MRAHFRMHAYVYVHIFACMRMCIFACMRMCIACMRMCMHIFACMRMCQKIDYNKRGLKLQYVYYNTLAMITLKYRGQWELQ